MTPRDIDRFFTALARAWPHRADLILVGGGVAVLAGSSRQTIDLDFEVTFPGGELPEDMDVFAAALHRAEAVSGVEGQFTTDFTVWSQVVMPHYRRSARRWKRFGALTVRRLETSLYVVSKLRRGLQRDLDDVLLVAGRERLSWTKLATACGRAVRLSPASTGLRGFTKRVEYFLRAHGPELWGARFDPAPALELFRATSRPRGTNRRSGRPRRTPRGGTRPPPSR